MVYNKDRDELYIIGLLMGSFKKPSSWTTKKIYQAMPFGPALQQLEFIHHNRLSNLRPIVGDQNGLATENSLPSLTQHPEDSDSTRPVFSVAEPVPDFETH